MENTARTLASRLDEVTAFPCIVSAECGHDGARTTFDPGGHRVSVDPILVFLTTRACFTYC